MFDLNQELISHGWHLLTDKEKEKTHILFRHSDMDAVKKFGRKSIFFRWHGCYTIYALTDKGKVIDDRGYTGIPTDKHCWELALAAMGRDKLCIKKHWRIQCLEKKESIKS